MRLPRFAVKDGVLAPFDDVGVSLADRGLLFGESLYEVVPITGGRARLLAPHVDRMRAAAESLHLREGVPPLDAWERTTAELVAAEAFDEGILYAQVTGGTAVRSHAPAERPRPTFFAFLQSLRFPRQAEVERGIRARFEPDSRWARCDLKTTMLLPAVLAKYRARDAGAAETIFLSPDDQLREGASSTIFIIEGERAIGVVPSVQLLPGVTGKVLGPLFAEAGLELEHDAIGRRRVLAADEVLACSTTLGVMPVLSIDGAPIGDGRAGRHGRTLAAALRRVLEISD